MPEKRPLGEVKQQGILLTTKRPFPTEAGVEDGVVKRAKEQTSEMEEKEDEVLENIVPRNVENRHDSFSLEGTMVGGRLMRHRGEHYSPPKPRKKNEPRPKRLPRWLSAWGRVENGMNIQNVVFPVPEDQHVEDEGTALFDSRLTAITEDIADEVEEIPAHKLTEYTVFDRNGSLAPLDAGLLEKDHELFICGVIKPIFDETNTCDGGPFCSRIGPITEWGVSGYDGGERVIIQVATVYAEYELLGTPSAEYTPFMISLREKAMLSKVVIDHLQDNYESSYEDMLMVIADKRPEGLESEPFSEETVLRHASYLLDQVWSYDQAGEEDDAQAICEGDGGGSGISEVGGENAQTGENQDDYKLFFSPAIQYLAKLEGYTLSDRRRVRRMGTPRQRGVRKDIHRGMPATTTPLVSWVFEDFFYHQVEGVKRVQDDSWMPFLIGFDGLEVMCKGPSKVVRGLLRFREGDKVPVIQLKDDISEEDDENESSEEDIYTKYVSLGKFERLAECPTKKPRESIKFVDTGLSLSKIAQESGWICTSTLGNVTSSLNESKNSRSTGGGVTLVSAEDEDDDEDDDDIVGMESLSPKKSLDSKTKGNKVANKHSTRPNSEGSMKRITHDDDHPSIDWVGDVHVLSTNNKAAGVKYYGKVRIEGEELELGDFCMALDEDGDEYLFCILSMWEQQKPLVKSAAAPSKVREAKKSNNKLHASSRPVPMFIGHKYIFGIDTMLGTAADAREVFMLDTTEVLPLSSVSCPCVCTTRNVPSNWSDLGGRNIEEYLQEINNLFNNESEAGKSEFFVQKLYNMENGSFVDIPAPRELLPRDLYGGAISLLVNSSLAFDVDAFVTDTVHANARREVALSTILLCMLDMIQYGNLSLSKAHSLLKDANVLLDSLRDTRTLGEPECCLSSRSGLVTYNVAQVDGQRFEVGECVYLQSETFSFRYNTLNEEPGWMKELEVRRKDKVRYPELYRLKEGRRFKGSHDGNVPFDIGQVLMIRKTLDEAIKLHVRRFYRPENTHWGEEFGTTQHLHRLYWSYEEQVVDINVVLGVCRVVRLTEEQIISMIDSNASSWDIWEGSTKHKDTFFFSNCYDTRSNSSPSLTSLPDEAGGCKNNPISEASLSAHSKARNDSDNLEDEDYEDMKNSPSSGTIKVDMTSIMDSLKKFPTTIDQERCRRALKEDCKQVKRSNMKGKGKAQAQVPLSDNHELSYETVNSAKDNAMKPLRCLDVFAGCGGLSLGLHQSGAIESKWAIEFEPRAAEAYKLNFPDVAISTDDCNVILKSVMEGKTTDSKGTALPQKGEVEALCGGPPCQGYSGMNRFNEGQYSRFKNSLVSTYLSYCDFYRPKIFLLENVKNFGHYKEGTVLRMCVRTLITMGYQVGFGCLQAANYGVPQSRRRMIIVACAPGEKLPDFPQPIYTFTSVGCQLTVMIGDVPYSPIRFPGGPAPLRRVTVRDAISDLPAVESGVTREEQTYNPHPLQSEYQRLMRRHMPLGKEKVIFDQVVKDMSSLHLARFRNIPCWSGADWRLLPNISVPLRPGYSTTVLEYVDSGTKDSKGKAGHGGVGHEPQDNTLIPWCLPHTGNRHNNWSGLYGRLDWGGHFGTTVTNPEPMGKQGVVIHPEQHRIVSVRECARSQGFPDHFRFAGTTGERYKQIGNAVPPPLARAIGEEWMIARKAKRGSIACSASSA